MAVDRLSVTVPSELGAALRALAKARGANVSTVVAEAIAHQVRMAALDLALEEADRRFGPLDEARLAEVEAKLIKTAKRGARRRSIPRKRAA
jgi:post-segregation antitoxin (ccd killing protein)